VLQNEGSHITGGSRVCSDTREQQTRSWSEETPNRRQSGGAGGASSPPSSGIGRAGVPQRRAEPALAVRSCRWGLALLKAQPGGIMGNRIPGSLPRQPGAAEG